MSNFRSVPFLAAVCLATSVSAQTDSALTAVRKQLGLPEAASITVAQDKSLPKGTLKLFVFAGSAKSPKNNFLDWIKTWNKKNGKDYGQIEVAAAQEDADVILAWYLVPELASKKKIAEEHVVSMPHISGQIPTDPTAGEGKVTEIHDVMMAPAFGYVLRRAAGGLEIVSRWAGDEPLKPNDKSGQNIWDQFAALRKPPAPPAR